MTSLTELTDTLIALIPEDGSRITNADLLEGLSREIGTDISEKEFKAAKDVVIKLGAAKNAKGPGGGLSAATSDAKLPSNKNQSDNKDTNLKSALWEAANILRGSAVDRTDWKGYILPILFYKRICDVWDEEYSRMLKDYGEDFRDEHRFQVPEGCHWKDIRSAPKDVGAALQNAMQTIELNNPQILNRVFGSGDWGNKEKFPDELIKDLIEGFSAIKLGNQAVSTDVLGDAYEYLVGKFADVTRRNKAGEFYTPRSVVQMMVEILDPKEGESIYDPACGTGGMLLAAIDHVKQKGGDPRTFFGKIYGQEKNLTTSSVARMNLVLHGIEDFKIVREDTLRKPAFTEGSGGLAKFDCVIANPPFSLEDWGRDIWENDPWGRCTAGLPPDKFGDFAWVQHMLASTATPSGSCVLVMPQGALSRPGIEAKIRKSIIESDQLDAVIGLAPNLFYGTPLPGSILIFNKGKDKEHQKKVLFIEAADLFRKGRAQNFLDPEHAKQILEWFHSYENVAHCAKVVSADEIKANGWSLNIPNYVPPSFDDEISPLPEATASFKDALTEAHAAEDHLRAVLIEGGWLNG